MSRISSARAKLYGFAVAEREGATPKVTPGQVLVRNRESSYTHPEDSQLRVLKKAFFKGAAINGAKLILRDCI